MGTTNQEYTVVDTSTWANFVALGSVISAQFTAAGWIKTSDTGQAVWTTTSVSITAATLSGVNITYTYTITSGPALTLNMWLLITGMTHSGNNGSFGITALGSGTFTVLNGSGVTETGSSGSGNSTVPNFSASPNMYEIWEPQDALQTGSTKYFLRIQYGANDGLGGLWIIGVALGTSTNGSGALTGTTTSNYSTLFSGNSSTFLCESDFSGDTGRFGCILARSGSSGFTKISFAVERTLTIAGVPGSDGTSVVVITAAAISGSNTTYTYTLTSGSVLSVSDTVVITGMTNSGNNGTFIITGFGSGTFTVTNSSGVNETGSSGIGNATGLYCVTLFGPSLFQVTIVFGIGLAPPQEGIVVIALDNSELFNNTIAISPAFPVYGKFGNPHTVCGAANGSDATEGLLIQTQLYGNTRTYIATKGISVAYNQGFLLMRWD
jgi:hypothetical protein